MARREATERDAAAAAAAATATAATAAATAATASAANDAEEHAALARAEGEAARIAGLAAGRAADVGATPDGDFAHLPVPIRPALARISGWTLDREISNRFIHFCHCDKNVKIQAVSQLLSTDPHVAFTRYSEVLAKCKNLAQWKARGLAAGIPRDSILNVRSPGEALRLLGLKFLFNANPGDVITADLRNRSFYVEQELEDYLSQ